AARVAISGRALRLRRARLRSFVLNGWWFRRGRWNFCFGYTDWSRRRDGIRGIVVGGLKRGLGRLVLTGFRILFGALETIAHPLAHVRFVTQLHNAGNPAQGKTYQSCQPGSCCIVAAGDPARVTACGTGVAWFEKSAGGSPAAT